MNVTGIWIIELPMDLQIFSNFYKTELTNFKFKIKDSDCELIKASDKTVNKIKVSITRDLEEGLYPFAGIDDKNNAYCDNEKMEKVIDFTNKMEIEVASIVEDLLDGFVLHASGTPCMIFDGHSFVTEYTVQFSPQIFGKSHKGPDSRERCTLNNEQLENAIYYATKEKDYLDLSWKFLCEAEANLNTAKYEMAIINMAIMAEYLVTSKLSSVLDDDGKFKKREHKAKARIPFVEKYFRFGLVEFGCSLPEDEVLEAVDFIYCARNKIVHRRKNAIQAFKELDLEFELIEMPGIMWELFRYSDKLHRYFKQLECKQ